VKRFSILSGLSALSAVVMFVACDDAPTTKSGLDAGVDSAVAVTPHTPGVCKLSECPTPKTGIACCTPDADCGNDPTGIGISCTPNADVLAKRECVLADCPKPALGTACCSPLGTCGWDPFGAGTLCIANGPPIVIPEGGVPPLCDLSKCDQTDGGPKACCQANGQCGVDSLGIGLCFAPPPTCDLEPCKTENGPKACCQLNGKCGVDTLGVGICFAPPAPLCDLSKCPAPADGGPKPCCQINGQCGVDTLGIGICFAPPPKATCDLKTCKAVEGLKPCCLPNGECGTDSLGIGLCFPPPPTLPDGGPVPVVTGPPKDPSVDGQCPSYLGAFGPVWGCCSDYGVCGTFSANQCLLALGTPLPVGPKPEAGVSEPFLRCNPPTK
jgi:hypothetical protein